LGVDLSHLYLAKTELQNAADAAALAGASALTIPTPDRITTAVDRAVSTMNLNKYNFNNKNLSDVMTPADERALVEFAVNLNGTYVSEATATTSSPGSYRFVRVHTPSVPISVLFAVPILGTTQNLDAKATSGLSIPGNVKFCPAPLSVVQCNPGDATCTLADDFKGRCPGAAAGTYPLQTVPPGEYDPDNNGTCDPAKEFCKGCTYTVRTAPAQGPSAGNYQVLACAGNGDALVRASLASTGDSCQCAMSPGDAIITEPGVGAGPVRQGLNVRFDVYSGGISYSTSTPPDTNIAQNINYTQYSAKSPFLAPSHTGLFERRLLVIPVIPISEFDNGRTTVHAGALGAFFMQNPVDNGNGGDIQLEYTGKNVTSPTGSDPSGTGVTNIVTPVLYR
jgi:Flp pilus assembly protein TadG